LAEEPQPFIQSDNSGDFEIVLGKQQMAGVLFVATVMLVVISAVSYLAGKGLSPAPLKEPEPAPMAAAAPAPVPAVILEKPATLPAIQPEAPLFSEPDPGATYLQMGAVEKGIAIIFAEGLRKHGLDAFVAPGPHEKIFRVLIGPMADPQAYERAKNIVDQIGLTTFGRKYEQ
jgi:cell division septation protein DedD